MKSFLTTLVFLVALKASFAQDSAILLSPEMFTAVNEIWISTIDGWKFKAGHHESWASDSISASDWKTLKPTELSAKLADTNGRLEGWLRFRFKLDKAFGDTALSLRFTSWAAADLYIDGILIKSFGNTGVYGEPFQEYNYSNKLPIPIHLTTDEEHLIALHFVDYTYPFPTRRLKSEILGLQTFLKITGPVYVARLTKHIREWPAYAAVWLTVYIILMFLFWLLVFLNPREKNLRLFALCVSFFAIQTICKTISEDGDISFTMYAITIMGFSILSLLAASSTVIIVARVFKNKVPVLVKILLATFVLRGLLDIFFSALPQLSLLSFIPVAIYIYYIITSWNSLKGAQWAIVTGLLISVIMIFIYISMVSVYKTEFIPYNYPIVSLTLLSFPISLLVYVALRFKEIIGEVRQNAEKVLRLSEEKREQALKQKEILEEEVSRQTIELKTSLENLKSTQSQLIQSEKMASLGELTAGIAHEIQNPLNFVNNFSEINKELLTEMKEGIDNGNLQDVKSIASDIIENEEKIMYHGKRADAIVKGMLQHSRTNNGQKEPTNINALADEYLRLAYHGLRARDSSFNAKVVTDFDDAIGAVDLIPQDMGRVILNLINNAFYAADEKRKLGPDEFTPTVSVTTKKSNGKLKIEIGDNGNGVPQKLIDKIFQPFFTTKPTGQGTGLGLSLSYDIVKAHGGELRVETREGEGSTFIIQLPV